MHQRDYLMRQIEQMSQALATLIRKLLGLKEEAEEEVAFKLTDELLKDQMKTSFDNILNLNIKEIPDFITKTEGLNGSNPELLAEIFMINAEITNDSDKKLRLLQTALELFYWSDRNSGTYSLERESKITHIEDQINKLTRKK